jgi:DUF1680 family protein
MSVALFRRVVLALPLIACTALIAAQAPAGRKPAGEYAIQAVPFTDVTVDDDFWAPRLERNATVTIQHLMEENERTNRVANFKRAAGQEKGGYEGKRFNDSDVYKTIEAAAYILRTHPNPKLQADLGLIIDWIQKAQMPDGYLYPARTLGATPPVRGIGPQRWVNLNGSHELYNVGHLYEAAVAWQTCIGSDSLMSVATKNFELVNREFGPNARKAAPGHEEIELALVKLYRLTGDERYFNLARFFLDQRGRRHDTQPYPPEEKELAEVYNDPAYMQDHLPVTQQTRATGHAVRAMYLYAAMTDVAALADDPAYARAVDRIWADMVSKRMYITGGIGSIGKIEGFGDDYELPNREAYAETCASVGNDLWNQRMFLLHGDGQYVDVLERVLYNGFLSGVSIDGKRFFYRNPLESTADMPVTDYWKGERLGYYDTACCPSNLARLMGQLPGFIYAHRDDQLFVNLFVGSTARVVFPFGRVTVSQKTRYPFDGNVRIVVTPDKPRDFEVLVRVPGWAREEPVPSNLYRYADRRTDVPTLSVKGEAVPLKVENGYVRIRRRWSPGDTVLLDLPMPVRRVVAHEGVRDDRGRAAIQRGPLVYAVEAADNNGRATDVVLPLSVVLKHEVRPDLLGGLGVVTGPGIKVGNHGSTRPVRVTAVPYFAWANRARGEMVVWLPYENKPRRTTH